MTRNAAAVIGRTKDLGTLEPGKLGDLVILDGDPLADSSDRLCTKNTSWALIERPYSCAPQAVGAVYDRPGFFVQSPGGDRPPLQFTVTHYTVGHLTTCAVVFYYPGVFLLFKRLRNAIPTIAMLVVMAGTAPAQWVKLPLPETPRMPDGKPNLTAPAPRTPDGKPDLSGIWTTNTGTYLNNLAGDGVEVPMQPWSAAMYKERHDSFGRDKPQVRCLPHGVPDGMLVPGYPFKIVQTARETIILQEEFNQFRQIFTDGRPLPVDPTPAWFGFSIAKWEGDTFVVESAGFNDGTWLDNGGPPPTAALALP